MGRPGWRESDQARRRMRAFGEGVRQVRREKGVSQETLPSILAWTERSSVQLNAGRAILRCAVSMRWRMLSTWTCEHSSLPTTSRATTFRSNGAPGAPEAHANDKAGHTRGWTNVEEPGDIRPGD